MSTRPNETVDSAPRCGKPMDRHPAWRLFVEAVRVIERLGPQFEADGCGEPATVPFTFKSDPSPPGPVIPAIPADAMLLDIDDAARVLRVSPAALRKRIVRGQVPGVVRTGRRIQIHRDRLADAMAKRAR